MRQSISSIIALTTTFALSVSAGFNVTIVYVDAPDCACQNDMPLASYSSMTSSSSSITSSLSSTTSSTSSTSTSSIISSTSTASSTSTISSSSTSTKSTSTSTVTLVLTGTYIVSTGSDFSTTVQTVMPSALSASLTTPVSVAPVAPTTASVAPAAGKDGASQALSGVNDGQATFYGGNVAGGMCSFSTYTLPSGIFGTALSDSNWDNAGLCGACVAVKGPDGNSITAMIVDQCPGCGPNHLDLFPTAFSTLANPTTGIISVSWNVVPCPVSGPITLRNKEGTSQYWFSMQVLNAIKPVTKLEVSTDNGATWQATQRKEYNFFEQQTGFGSAPLTIRVTSQDGGIVVVDNVEVASGTSITAGSNF